jgi:cytochrome c oxidase subunit 4
MSTESVVSRPEEHHGTTPAEPGAHAHPSDKTYYVVALVLGALTALEVGIYYIKGGLTYIPLLILMALKFVIVVGFFMHLRFDSPVFRRLFAMGLAMAIFIYSVVFFTFGVFHV